MKEPPSLVYYLGYLSSLRPEELDAVAQLPPQLLIRHGCHTYRLRVRAKSTLRELQEFLLEVKQALETSENLLIVVGQFHPLYRLELVSLDSRKFSSV